MTKGNGLGSMSVPIDGAALAKALADGSTIMIAKDMISEKFVQDRAEDMGEWIAKKADTWAFLKKPVSNEPNDLAGFCSCLGDFLASMQEPTKGWFPLISVPLSDMEEYCGPLIYRPQLVSVLAKAATHFHARESLSYTASAKIVDVAYAAKSRLLSDKRICIKNIHVFRVAACLLDIKWLSETIAAAKGLSAESKKEVNALEDAADHSYRSLVRQCLI